MSLTVSLSLKLSLMFSFDFQHFNRDTTTKLILNEYICKSYSDVQLLSKSRTRKIFCTTTNWFFVIFFIAILVSVH